MSNGVSPIPPAATYTDPATQVYAAQREPYVISTEPTWLDLDVIHGFLYHSYWSPGIPRQLVEQAVAHSLNFGLYHLTMPPGQDAGQDAEQRRQQVGFARVVTDYSSFAYLADLFVLAEHRGQGLGLWLVETVLACPALRTLRSFALATRDAQELYRKFGFVEVDGSRSMQKSYPMEWRDPALIRE